MSALIPVRSLAELDRLLDASRCLGPAAQAGWTFDLPVVLPTALLLGLYGLGVGRLWMRAGPGRGAGYLQAAGFLAGWAALAAALVSPLHAASRILFTAHMIEHEVLMAVAAPLLVYSRPLGPLLWSLPQRWRVAAGAVARSPAFARAWKFLTDPLVATCLHGAAIWIWHVPALFDAALREEPLHWLQHFSFFATALLFWWSIAQAKDRRQGYGLAVLYLFVTSLHTSLLGALLFVSSRPWFTGQRGAAALGLSPLEDQQLAGLIMWVPGGLLYAAAALALAAKWIAAAGEGPALPWAGGIADNDR